MFEMSNEINEITKAMALAQKEMKPAKKSADNPFFKSKYADLAEIISVCSDPLNNHGLIFMQFPTTNGNQVTVITQISHESGQFFRNSLTLTAKAGDPQSIGSAITYAKRYALAAMLGIATEDDDGAAASGTTVPKKQGRPAQQKPPMPFNQALEAKQQMQMFEPPAQEQPHYKCADCGADIVQVVYDFSMSKYKRPLCRNCQKKV